MPASFLVAGRFDITSDLAGVLWQPSRMASSPNQAQDRHAPLLQTNQTVCPNENLNSLKL